MTSCYKTQMLPCSLDYLLSAYTVKWKIVKPFNRQILISQMFRKFCNSTEKLKSECREYKVVKRFSQKELDEFSTLTGDLNPIHSTATPVQDRKVHGALLNAVISGLIGTHLPGAGTIVLEQNFKFLKACKVEVDAEFCVRLIRERKISLAEYRVKQEGEIVLKGLAKLLTRHYI